MLVETIAKKSQKIKWAVTIDGKSYSHNRILRVSMDKFYEIVFGDKLAFAKLCKALPIILDDVISQSDEATLKNSVCEQLKEKSAESLKSLYLLAFETYEGFDRF